MKASQKLHFTVQQRAESLTMEIIDLFCWKKSNSNIQYNMNNGVKENMRIRCVCVRMYVCMCVAKNKISHKIHSSHYEFFSPSEKEDIRLSPR
jgi:hypothetical protein